MESQRLTAPETFAAVIANKLLKSIADFVPKADNPSIRMVNGELMAKRAKSRLNQLLTIQSAKSAQ
jgi:hypothetical protein